MNFHSDEWIMDRVREHYNEALEYFPEDRIVGIFLQGSQNYGLDTEGSDIDTKLIVVPTFDDLAFNRQPVSTTHVRANNEHIDFKDIRLMLQTFRKHNLNFIEILFTPYYILNPIYADLWNTLIENREVIARSNPIAAIKSIKGIALEKFHALEHRYPSKIEVLDKYSFDPKQLHHLIRVRLFLKSFIAGKSYLDCINPGKNCNWLKRVKNEPEYLNIDLGNARILANVTKTNIENDCEKYLQNFTKEEVEKSEGFKLTEQYLDSVQYEIMKIAIKKELEK